MSHIYPAKLMVPVNHTVAPLAADFARGWRKLPDELKCEILAHNLVREKPIQRHEFLSETSSDDEVLYHHMCLGPEIAELARETYAKNTIILNNSIRVGNFFLLPYERKYVKKLVLPWLFIDDTQHWNIIEAFARHAFGFSTLNQVTICLTMHREVEERPGFPTLPVRLRSGGQIEFSEKFTEAQKSNVRKLFVCTEILYRDHGIRSATSISSSELCHLYLHCRTSWSGRPCLRSRLAQGTNRAQGQSTVRQPRLR